MHELVLHGDLFYVDKHVYMYEPPILAAVGPPTEELQHDRFTIDQLSRLAREFKAVFPDGVAPHGQLVALVHSMSAAATGTALFPAAWVRNARPPRLCLCVLKLSSDSNLDGTSCTWACWGCLLPVTVPATAVAAVAVCVVVGYRWC
jgi:hypothetical protein